MLTDDLIKVKKLVEFVIQTFDIKIFYFTANYIRLKYFLSDLLVTKNPYWYYM